MVFKKQLPQSIRDAAFYNDPIEGRLDLFAKIEQGKRLPEKGLKQLDHAFDLAKFRTNDPAERESVDMARSRVRDVLGQNDFVRYLSETTQDPAGETFEYKGTAFPKAQGPILMRKEHDFFADRDRFMTPPEIKQLDKKLREESPPVQIAQAYDGPPNPTNTPIGSRPPGESGAFHQAISRSNAARDSAAKLREPNPEYQALQERYGSPLLESVAQGITQKVDANIKGAANIAPDYSNRFLELIGKDAEFGNYELHQADQSVEQLKKFHPNAYGFGQFLGMLGLDTVVGIGGTAASGNPIGGLLGIMLRHGIEEPEVEQNAPSRERIDARNRGALEGFWNKGSKMGRRVR